MHGCNVREELPRDASGTRSCGVEPLVNRGVAELRSGPDTTFGRLPPPVRCAKRKRRALSIVWIALVQPPMYTSRAVTVLCEGQLPHA